MDLSQSQQCKHQSHVRNTVKINSDFKCRIGNDFEIISVKGQFSCLLMKRCFPLVLVPIMSSDYMAHMQSHNGQTHFENLVGDHTSD